MYISQGIIGFILGFIVVTVILVIIALNYGKK